MPSGLTEVPGQLVDSLKGSPMLLVIAVMNIFMIGSLLWFGSEISKSRSVIIDKLIDRCTAAPSRTDLFSPIPMTPKPFDVRKED